VVYLLMIYCWDGAQAEISNSKKTAATIPRVKRMDRIMYISNLFNSVSYSTI
jgi:hypothetical protein